MPNLQETASTSCMMLRITMTNGGIAEHLQLRWRRVSALTGFKEALPRTFTQISCRIRVVTGQRKPEAISASAIWRERSERVPSGSPRVMRFPSMC